VLYTSLGGTRYSWTAPWMLALIIGGGALLVAFVFAERRAAEPIVPLELFRNRVFTVTSAVGFIVGLALFGAITYLPLYLQDVKGHTPTISGLLLLPLVIGLLIASVGSGQLITRFGRYKPFPIAGTAIMVVGLLLLSRLQVDTPPVVTGAYMLVLGFGLGNVIQVLVLAAQNSVDYKYLGVASSGSTLFRQIGGSIGVSVFGAVFANQLRNDLARTLPPGAHVPASAANPAVVKQLPAALRDPFGVAITDALTTVFLVATGIAFVGFVLTWLLPEVPLKTTAGAPDPGDGLHPAHDDDALRELERALSRLARREERWQLYERLASRAGLDLAPPELWLLARLGERAPLTDTELDEQLPVDPEQIASALEQLELRALVDRNDAGPIELTKSGREDYERIVTARRDGLRELLQGWDPDEHPPLRELIDKLGRDLVSEIPMPAPVSG